MITLIRPEDEPKSPEDVAADEGDAKAQEERDAAAAAEQEAESAPAGEQAPASN